MPHSLVDSLADQLSKRTGSTFVVDRLPQSNKMAPPRYRIRVSRGEHTFSFGETSVTEAKRSIAMVSDLIDMGFINARD